MRGWGRGGGRLGERVGYGSGRRDHCRGLRGRGLWYGGLRDGSRSGRGRGRERVGNGWLWNRGLWDGWLGRDNRSGRFGERVGNGCGWFGRHPRLGRSWGCGRGRFGERVGDWGWGCHRRCGGGRCGRCRGFGERVGGNGSRGSRLGRHLRFCGCWCCGFGKRISGFCRGSRCGGFGERVGWCGRGCGRGGFGERIGRGRWSRGLGKRVGLRRVLGCQIGHTPRGTCGQEHREDQRSGHSENS